ncbi:hypothetical protein AO353_09685 [Pseudomonas fluorescens]|uniref:Uncharacterized protein n=1 Tax=Pseudomonas fluorescens TaxID=294 RepID=A0A0N7GZU6_PSEFL|nr:hypothetical protein AO353_09685 [Pseudomonas fluorescens]
MVVADFLMSARAIDPGQWFIAVIGVEVEAALTFMFLQQTQAIPGEASLTQRVAVVVILGFLDASTERVIGHPDHAAVCVAHFNQSAFGVVGEALQAPFSAALFDQSAGAGWWAVQQVGGGVVGEGFALAVQAVLASDDSAISIIGFVGASCL